MNCKVAEWTRIASAKAAIALMVAQPFLPQVAAAQTASAAHTATPIKHVIVIIGENRTFDHIFATYKPKAGEAVDNLLSKGIIKEDGTPGPNFSGALQRSASDTASEGYQLAPGGKSPYAKLPTPLAG